VSPRAGIDGGARRLQALDGLRLVAHRLGGIAGRILDGQPRHAGLQRQADTVEDRLGRGPEAALEIGVDRQVAHGRHIAHVREGIVA